ncbi:addiction module protein [Gulosibacter macacae]|uniref:Addiction module protein n=2 Tax=Gulosibacter macacae TaxID=2488791 RepID=A0A3P3VZY5_9MICO|nr:addiction module protein [Gulosibacter macacae]
MGMSMNVAEVEQALLALDEHDRAAVIHRGLRSLDAEDANADQAEVDAAWRVELRRRIDDIESGKVELLDVDESHAQLRAELAARRA